MLDPGPLLPGTLPPGCVPPQQAGRDSGRDPGGAPRADRWDLLTAREREVAALVARGMTNKDIAARLFVSKRTVDAHVEHILNKLGYSSRVQVAALACRELAQQERHWPADGGPGLAAPPADRGGGVAGKRNMRRPAGVLAAPGALLRRDPMTVMLAAVGS